MKPAKPVHGQKCNGCGECCRRELCSLAVRIFAPGQAWADGPCPALIDKGDTYGCGLVETPRKFAPVRAQVNSERDLRDAALLFIGSGIGCDAQLDNEPADEAFRQRMRAQRPSSVRISVMLRTWGFRQ